jgi:hypothetical protein
MAEAVILSLGRLAGDGRRGAVRHNPFRTLVVIQLFLQVRVKIITGHRFLGHAGDYGRNLGCARRVTPWAGNALALRTLAGSTGRSSRNALN